jgi:hypothetical protein
VTSPSANLQVNPAVSTGITDVKIIRTLPPNMSVTAADFYIKFALSKKIPKGAFIQIQSPSAYAWLPTANFNNYVFFSKAYQSASISANTLSI